MYQKITQLYGIHNSDIKIMVKGDLAFGNGLASSGAMYVALITALEKYKNNSNISAAIIAEKAYRFEHDLMNIKCGKQDHYAAAFSGMNYFIFCKDESVERIPIKLNDNEIRYINQNILLIHSGLFHQANDILKSQSEKVKERKLYYDQLRSLAVNLKDYIVKSGFGYEIHRFVDEGWQLKQLLDRQIADSRINKTYEILKERGWKGIKLLGAGGGGYFMVMLNDCQLKYYINSIAERLDLPFCLYKG